MSDQTPPDYYPEDIPYQPRSDYPTDSEEQKQGNVGSTEEQQAQGRSQSTDSAPSLPQPYQPYRSSSAPDQATYTSPNAYNVYETKPKPQIEPGSSMAVSGFTLSIVSLISWLLPTTLLGLPIPIVGIVFSALGLRSTIRHKMALVGLIISIIGLLIHIIFIALVILAAMLR